MGSVRIISDSCKPFFDRIQAGKEVGEVLGEYADRNTVILGIPRGGVVIAEQIAEELDCDMDIVLAHKLGAPGNEELAIGAVCEGGEIFINTELAGYVGATAEYLEHEKERRLEEIQLRTKKYRDFLDKVDIAGKIVIVTDDGIATGETMKAAVWAVIQERPKKVIAALPVGPPDSFNVLSEHVDEIVCLRGPSYLGAIGNFYLDFRQVTDIEVAQMLRAENKRRDR